ncbi:DNA alkylation repair protein [Brevibacillus invocatus]|uniref:DNA alkylation repair protein n=1 Tax=Brevibacillus invocatus TaxID=173959 RepID=UPI00203CF3EE|nr:DNA alkylation repair protein [Brevibacillus invocatus]MCM3081665.1 DNA alkylation repair protein [Brevibacillus invocatus]MCM3431982.1 DNA alkylation repair protein [Brevibacillus invocatus]
MWEERFQDAVVRSDISVMLDILHMQVTKHAITPKQSVKDKALKIIYLGLQQSATIYNVGIQLANSKSPTGEELGAIVLATHYNVNPSEVNSVLLKLADNTHWEVREWVASACAIVLTNNFQNFYPVLLGWTKNHSPNVRRAVVVAVKYSARKLEDNYAELLIDLIEPLLCDEDRYVKRNLGAFAIGDGILKYYPKHLINRLNIWINSENEHVRWNIMKIFSTAEGIKYIEDSIHVLKILSNDQRKIVKSAFKSTILSIKKRDPEIFHKYFGKYET